ncbi:thioredoxin family protein [Mycoplasma buteonis]|uniref:thioredoxin family protein n=1 Tax=Mycoplasma buteonis TaxID=171280 RepID=UPI00055FD4FE|nr:thioredoxin family protein [Mycoplasma buteonis]
MLKEVNKQQFLDAAKEGLQLLVFYADWCGPCKMYKGTLEEISQKDNVEVFRVNIDSDKDFAIENNVASIPHTKVYYNGQFQGVLQGYKPYENLKQDLSEFLK